MPTKLSFERKEVLEVEIEDFIREGSKASRIEPRAGYKMLPLNNEWHIEILEENQDIGYLIHTPCDRIAGRKGCVGCKTEVPEKYYKMFKIYLLTSAVKL